MQRCGKGENAPSEPSQSLADLRHWRVRDGRRAEGPHKRLTSHALPRWCCLFFDLNRPETVHRRVDVSATTTTHSAPAFRPTARLVTFVLTPPPRAATSTPFISTLPQPSLAHNLGLPTRTILHRARSLSLADHSCISLELALSPARSSRDTTSVTVLQQRDQTFTFASHSCDFRAGLQLTTDFLLERHVGLTSGFSPISLSACRGIDKYFFGFEPEPLFDRRAKHDVA